MKPHALRLACLLSSAGALAGLSSAAIAQAPATAQVWDVRFVVDPTGPHDPTSTLIGITLYARVGILPNTSASGARNFGPSRVGGNPVRITFTDPLSAALNLNQGTVSQGETATNPSNGPGFQQDNRAFLDTDGRPLAGHFAPFRGSLAPQQGPLFLGSNTDISGVNGVPSNPATGSPFMPNLVGSRALNFGSEGTQAWGNADTPTTNNPADLVGDLAPIYRLYYAPRPGAADRDITVDVTGLSARYIYAVSSPFSGASAVLNLPNQSFTFHISTVPTPGAASLLGLGGLLATRRRRSSK